MWNLVTLHGYKALSPSNLGAWESNWPLKWLCLHTCLQWKLLVHLSKLWFQIWLKKTQIFFMIKAAKSGKICSVLKPYQTIQSFNQNGIVLSFETQKSCWKCTISSRKSKIISCVLWKFFWFPVCFACVISGLETIWFKFTNGLCSKIGLPNMPKTQMSMRRNGGSPR